MPKGLVLKGCPYITSLTINRYSGRTGFCHLINYLFIGGSAPDPIQVGDANLDGVVNIADVVYLVNYLFENGPVPCN
jgi:hypothetical protein